METLLSQFDSYLHNSLPLAMAAAYLAGLLASLTPCVYPMIPITAGMVGSANVGGTRTRGFTLALTYVTGLALMYAGLGMFAAATGRFFGTINTSPWVLFALGNAMLLLGLAMVGVFALPTFAPKGAPRAKGHGGAFMIGMTSAFAAGPCTAPVLGGLLSYVAASGNLLRGGLLLFLFAFGMGTLLLGVGTFSGLLAAIPRSGLWMTRIKLILGLAMIGLAEYFFVRAGMAIL